MITLYGFGPAFGLPDASPFVVKVETLLKMAGLPYQRDTKGFRKAPKGKLPYIRDTDGTLVTDSTFIRFYLEHRYGIDFDAGLTATERGIAWAVEKMCEEHLYWLLVYNRWLDEGQFRQGFARLFDRLPAPIRPLAIGFIRRKIRGSLQAQGLGRHSDAERAELGRRNVDAIAAVLGDNPYLLGGRPCAADATVYAFVNFFLCPNFDEPVGRHARTLPSLVAYRQRLTDQYFSDRPAETSAAAAR